MTRTLNFVEGEGISVQAGPNPGDDTVLDVEIANTAPADPDAAAFDPSTATQWWMPLVDSPDGTCVLDDTGLIPTLIPLT